MKTITLDDLPVVAVAKRPTKAQAQAAAEMARCAAIRKVGMDWRLSELLRHYDLDTVIEMWWKAQVQP